MPRADISIYPNTMARTSALQGIPIREDVLFTNEKGEENAKARRQNEKYFQKLAPALARLLLPDEAVFYVVRAQSQLSALEQFTAGWWVMLMAGCAIVATNRRLLIFPVKMDGSWRESAQSVLWGDLAEVKVSGVLSKTLKLRFQDGKSASYLRIPRGNGLALEAIAAAMMPAAVGEQSPYRGMVSLCPDCRNVLTPRVYACGTCGLVFKNEKTMRMYSIFLPGGGYFYIGYPILGIFLCIAEGFVLLGLFGELAAGKPEDALPLLVTFAFLWAIETAVTILHSQRHVRQFIPLKRTNLPADAFAAGAGQGPRPF